MSDEEQQPEPSTTVKVIKGTVTTMEVTDRAALGMGAVETVLPGVTKAAATTLSESAPIIGPIAGKTVGFLGRWGGRIAVPLQIVIGGGSAIYHGVKGDYVEMGGDIGGTVGGVGGGIAVGAAIGSIVPGVGTVIGGAIGGVVGYFAGEKAGKMIAGHYVSKAEAEKRTKEDLAKLDATYTDALSSTPATSNATAAVASTNSVLSAIHIQAKTETKPESQAQNFKKVAQGPTSQTTQTTTTTDATTEVTTETPATQQVVQTPQRSDDSLGVLLDKSADMHGSDLSNVFQRVSKFADENHLSLGAKFSMASMFLSILNVVNFGGWANGMIESVQHFAIDAMKGDLINQGPNLAGSSDTRPHQQVAAGNNLTLAQQPG